MAKPLTTTLPPKDEAEFIEKTQTYWEMLARDARGGKLGVVAYYQQVFGERLRALGKSKSSRRKATA